MNNTDPLLLFHCGGDSRSITIGNISPLQFLFGIEGLLDRQPNQE